MAQNILVVLISPEPGTRKAFQDAFRAQGDASVIAESDDLMTGYESVIKYKPNLVVIDIDHDSEQAFNIMANFFQHFPGLAIFACSNDSSSETILRAMRAGATEYIVKPVDPDGLAGYMHKVRRLALQAAPLQAANENGKVIACYSPKGGVGTTTMAVNLAVCLQALTHKQVVLIDLDLESGDVGMFLNLKPKYTISDVAANITRLDSEFLQGILARHDSGILVLAEPQRLEDVDNITSDQVRTVLDILRRMFPYVVVDTAMGYGDRNLEALDSADMVLMPSVLSIPVINNLQKTLDIFTRLGYGPEKLRLVVNRYEKRTEITVASFEKTLDYKVFHLLPNNYRQVMSSINRGLPLLTLLPDEDITKAYNELAKAVRDALIEKSMGEQTRLFMKKSA